MNSIIFKLSIVLSLIVSIGMNDANAWRKEPNQAGGSTYYFTRDEVQKWGEPGTYTYIWSKVEWGPIQSTLLSEGVAYNFTTVYRLEGASNPAPVVNGPGGKRGILGVADVISNIFNSTSKPVKLKHREIAVHKGPTETDVTRACVLEMDDFIQREGALAAKKIEVRSKIDTAFSEFDKRGALLLKMSSDSWTNENSVNVAQVLCAIDGLKATTEAYNSASEAVANGSVEGREAYDLSGDSLRASLGYLAETSRAVKDDGTFAEKQGMYQFAKATGEVLLDLATSITPGVAVGRDAYEAITGKNLLTQAELTIPERSFSVLCVASLGTGNILKGALKGVEKIAGLARAGHRAEVAEHSLKRAVIGAENLAEWVGKDTRVITNIHGDKVFLNETTGRKIRFDILNHPHGTRGPHMHMEKYNPQTRDWEDAFENIHQFIPRRGVE